MSGTSSPFYTSSNGSCAYGKGLENYKARKAAGELLPHLPWNQREWSFTQTSKGQSYTYGSPGKVWWDEWPASHLFAGWSSLDNYPEFPGEPPIELPDADYFVQKSAARIASQGFDSLTFLAELNKTRDMFKNTLKRFVKMSKKSKRKKKRKPNRLESLGSYMSDYLEARYGWRVLAFELDDLYSAVYEFDKKRTRFSERSGYSTTHVVDLSEVIENAETIWTKSWTDTYEISVRGNVSADFSPARWQFNPFVTAWETIPYSFVVDWFVHIGQALEATSFLVFADAYYASTGYHVSVTRDYDVEYVDNPSGSDTGTYYGRVSVRGTGSWTNRTPTSVSFSPLTEIRLDGWKIMDLIALAKDFILPSSGGKPRSFRR
jgi:hypothetical protein